MPIEREPPSVGASEDVLWSANVETGDISQFIEGGDPQQEGSPEPQIVSDPVRGGEAAVAFTIPGGGKRNEFLPGPEFTEGDDRWFGFSTFLQEGFPVDAGWSLITQWKNDGTGSPPLELSVDGGQYSISGGYGHPDGPQTWSEPLADAVTGEWVDWTLHIVFSDGPDALVEVWKDGKPALLGFSPEAGTLYPGLDSYLKLGYYRDTAIEQSGTVVHDNWVVGLTADSVGAPSAGESSGPAIIESRTTIPQTGPVDRSDQPVPAGGTEVCEQFGSTPVANGEYEVQNNVWGSELPQCVRAFDTGFEVVKGDHTNDAGPASYPSIFTGCHYGTCTEGTLLPRQVSQLGQITSDWSIITSEDNRWNAAYDIWFDPTSRQNGTVTGTEMMIWLDDTGPQPIGEQVDTVQLEGVEWGVWRGTNGAEVISYVHPTGVSQVTDLSLSAFFQDALQRGIIQEEWYLTSIQAGFEPWTGGAGMTVRDFSVTGVTRATA